MGGDRNSFDVIGATELFGMTHGESSLPDYYPLEFPNSKGGIGIYVKDNHKYKVRSDLSIFISHILESKSEELLTRNR